MKILYAVHGYKPAYRVGGPIMSVSAVAERLVRRGHEVTVFTSNANLDEVLDVPVDQPVDVDGVKVWYFRCEEYLKRWLPFVPYLSRSQGFLYAPAMRATLDRVVPSVDIVHTQMPYVYPTFAAGRAAFRHGKPLFYHQRGVFDPERLRFRGLKKRAYIEAFEKPVMRRAASLVALTSAEEASFRALGVSTACRVIPNGVEVTEYRTTPRGDPLAEWSVPTNAPVVLFLGRIHPVKGADRLLEAFARVQQSHRDAYLVMAGPDEWRLEATFRDRARAGGWSDRLVFTGMVAGETKLDLLARASMFALPSDGEGFSMAVLEALASGTPVVLSPGCNFPEVGAAGVGWIVANEPSTIADVISRALTDRDALAAMGARGRAFVAERYTWERVTDQFVEAYEAAVASSLATAAPRTRR